MKDNFIKKFGEKSPKCDDRDCGFETLQHLLQKHAHAHFLSTNLLNELEIITEQSNDSGTKVTNSTYMTQSFLTLDFTEINDKDDIQMVYVKSMIENNLNNIDTASSTSGSSSRPVTNMAASVLQSSPSLSSTNSTNNSFVKQKKETFLK